MKKLVVAGTLLAVFAVAGFIAYRSIFAQNSTAEPVAVSRQTAEELQKKIDRLKKSDKDRESGQPVSEIEVTEAELESYVLFELRDQIPLKMDSFDVQLTPGAVGADTQLTFGTNSTGNPIVDAFVGGTHNLFVKGKLSGEEGRGKFELSEIRVDGIPVPKVLIQTLIDKYVKPRYPDADLKEPFNLPWSIRSIDIRTGKATIVY